MNVRKFLRRLLIRPLFKLDAGEWENARLSFAQYGEDCVLAALMMEKEGFYVDVGAHHPLRCSNTHLFYRRGWRGINIEPNPAFCADFQHYRPRDVNLCALISDRNEPLHYAYYREPLYNGVVEAHKACAAVANRGAPLSVEQRTPRRLDDILEKHAPDRPIDLLSVDCEGHDLAVLRSNDWSRFAPRFVIVEAFGKASEQTHAFMRDCGYQVVTRLYLSTIFALSSDVIP